MTVSLTPRRHARAWITRYMSTPLARMLLALHVSPNVLTLAGLVLAAAAGYLLAEGHLLIGGIIMWVGALGDMLDGAVARLGSRVSRFGAFLDSVADRLSESVVFFGLLIFYVDQSHELGVYLSVSALVASMMVSYLRARSESLGVSADVGFMGRPERIVVLGIGLLAGFPLLALAAIVALASLTVVQRVVHAARQMQEK